MTTNVKTDFGAIGNGTTDDTNAFKSAISYLETNGGGDLYIPNGKYKITDTLEFLCSVCLKGESQNAILEFNNWNPTIYKNALVVKNLSVRYGEIREVISNLRILGSASYNQSTFNNLLTGILFQTHEITLSNIQIIGFNKSIDFDSNAYLITFYSSSFRYANYGVYFNASSTTNSGENISFIGCCIANNIHGIYNNLGELFFTNCSIDYNDYQIIENITDLEGVMSGVLCFTASHFEGNLYGIINNGKMKIINCTLWHDYPTNNTTAYIQNNKNLFLIGNSYRVAKYPYLITGNKPMVSGVSSISEDVANYIHKNCSKIENGDFETSYISLWTTNYGSRSISTTKKHSGTSSLKIVGEQYANGECTTIIKTNGKTMLFIGLFVNNEENSTNEASYILLKGSDINNSIIFDESIYIPKQTGFVYVHGDNYNLPQNTVNLSIALKGSMGSTKSVYFDDIYVSFLDE